MKKVIITILIGLLQTIVASTFVVVYAETAYPIAGTQPDQRPASAPVIQRYEKDDLWYAVALTGLEQPYPFSFRFLEDQERWYTPFTRPGMRDRYDIRQWHGGQQ